MPRSSITKRARLWQKPPLSYFVSLIGVALMTTLIYVTHSGSIANISMLYLLVVTASALFLGRIAAVLCSITSFLMFDYFFVEPIYQLTVQDPSEWLALCMFLLTATIIGQLTALLRIQAEEARMANGQTAAIAESSWLVASEFDRERVLRTLLQKINSEIEARETALLEVVDSLKEPGSARWLTLQGNEAPKGASEQAIDFALANLKSINIDQNDLWEKALALEIHPTAIYLPIAFEGEVLGLLYIDLEDSQGLKQAQKNFVTSLANHAAVVLHRDKIMQLELKAKALTEADRLKTALLAMVSHDFRSPLTSIKTSVESLMQEGAGIDKATQLAMLEAVDNETDRLNRMVGNILNLSKLEAGAWRPLFELIPITELVGAALDSISKEQNRRVIIDIDPGVDEVFVDAVQMTQVLTNILENALKYSKEAVDFKIFRENDRVIFAVLDSGVGLAAGEEEQVFLPFYRAARLAESSIPGMGIGLAVSKGLVEAHKGNLRARNRKEGGAEFRVSLPIHAQESGLLDAAKDISHR